ncbi:hypothetical protein M885DRAFT_571822 [Pelagophyceae sp. CCMP2097]|nr:hypothetical protein M885DRAFT_571822 [Pelagophyceae sp. CCMP2097]
MADGLRAAWVRALDLSEAGQVHAAVMGLEFPAASFAPPLSVAAEMQRQLDAARRLGCDAERMQRLLAELLDDVEREVQAHLDFLEGNFYAALDVAPLATDAEIRKRAHPDKSGGTPRLFLIMRLAYETLNDAAARRRYTPLKSAEAWATWRLRHAARFRNGVGGGAEPPSAPVPHPQRRQPQPVPRKTTEQQPPAAASKQGAREGARPRAPWTPEAVASMSVSELKVHLTHLGLSIKLERPELEADLLAACGLGGPTARGRPSPARRGEGRDDGRGDAPPAAPSALDDARRSAALPKHQRRRAPHAEAAADARSADEESGTAHDAQAAAPPDSLGPRGAGGRDGSAAAGRDGSPLDDESTSDPRDDARPSSSRVSSRGSSHAETIRARRRRDDGCDVDDGDDGPDDAERRSPGDTAEMTARRFVEHVCRRAGAPLRSPADVLAAHAVATRPRTPRDAAHIQAEVDFWISGSQRLARAFTPRRGPEPPPASPGRFDSDHAVSDDDSGGPPDDGGWFWGSERALTGPQS